MQTVFSLRRLFASCARYRSQMDSRFRGNDVKGAEKNLTWRAYLALVLLCLCFYLPGIVSLPPTDRDESFFAQATKQMIETHDYVDINFLGTPRYKKPVGIYWLQSFSVRALNPDHLDEIWAYRVPSLIGAVIAVLMTAALGTLLFGGMTGFVAGVMLASCLDLDIEAHLAKTDAALLASVMVMQYALARAYSVAKAGWKNAFAFWTAMGIGILLKGPIILLPFFSTLIWLRCTDKKLPWFKRLKPIMGLPYLLMLILPWFIAINMASHGRFAEQAGGHDFLAKLWQGQDRGFMPPGYYVLLFPAFFFPFSLFALLALPDAWKARRDHAVNFLLGWIIPSWIVFEIAFTKLPHYVLPVYPAIAILTAKFFLDGFPALVALTKRWFPATIIGLWTVIGMGFAIAAAVLPYIVNGALDPLQIACSLILLIAQGAGLLFFVQGKKAATLVSLVCGALIFSGVAFAATAPGLHRLWIAREIMDEARRVTPCPHFSVVSAGYQEPSLGFLAGTGTKLVPNGTFAAAEMQHDHCRVGVIDAHLLTNFLYSSSDFPDQPRPAGSVIEGVNTGHGAGTKLFLYVMPQTPIVIPAYP